MIELKDIAEVGIINKPHGIRGEVSATLDIDVDLHGVKCIIIPIEGIFVPFFISSIRPKTVGTCLLSLEGIDSDTEARGLTNKTFYILRKDLPEPEEDDEDGMYASDFIGYRIEDEKYGYVGDIVGLNDATDNVLFEVEDKSGKTILIPVADEFIVSIDTENAVLETDIPQGLIDLN